MDDLQQWRRQYCADQGMSDDTTEILAAVLDSAVRSLFDSGYPSDSPLSQRSSSSEDRATSMASTRPLGPTRSASRRA